MTKNPRQAWNIVNAVQHAIAEGEHGLSALPGLIIKIVDGEWWKEIYCEPTKAVVTFKSFAEFVTSPLPEGLGCEVRTLRNLCRDDAKATDAIDRATTGRQGERTDLVDNINKVSRPDGTSRDAALRRLRKDRPDLHAKVLDGACSANAAMVEAGFRKKPSPKDQLQKAVKKVNADGGVYVSLRAVFDAMDAAQRKTAATMWQGWIDDSA